MIYCVHYSFTSTLHSNWCSLPKSKVKQLKNNLVSTYENNTADWYLRLWNVVSKMHINLRHVQYWKLYTVSWITEHKYFIRTRILHRPYTNLTSHSIGNKKNLKIISYNRFFRMHLYVYGIFVGKKCATWCWKYRFVYLFWNQMNVCNNIQTFLLREMNNNELPNVQLNMLEYPVQLVPSMYYALQ